MRKIVSKFVGEVLLGRQASGWALTRRHIIDATCASVTDVDWRKEKHAT